MLPMLWLLVTGGGVGAYLLLMDVPFLRSSGLAATGLMVVGTTGGVVTAWRRRRAWPWVAAGASVTLTLAWLVGFHVLARLPEATTAKRLARAIDFTLRDQTGRPVSLAKARGAGPVLLVFFRGAW